MKDFRSYRAQGDARRAADGAEEKRTASGAAAAGKGGAAPEAGGREHSFEGEAAALAKKALNAYNGRSEGAVLAEIVREAERMKRAGTLSDADLEAFYAQFSPLLDGGQQRKFRAVIERLKRI